MFSYDNATEPEPDMLSYDNATEPEPDVLSYDNATELEPTTCLAMTTLQTRTMTPLRTQNEIAMAVLPVLNRQAPLNQD
jgi:hypothetical protein